MNGGHPGHYGGSRPGRPPNDVVDWTTVWHNSGELPGGTGQAGSTQPVTGAVERKECMEYLIGVALAAAACVVFGMLAGFDRERIFYPMMLPPIATYYVLFAAMAGSTSALTIESLVACIFLAVAVVGFRKNLWLTVAGLVGHGVFDFFHHLMIQNPGVPVWWPGFCMSFDVLAGAFLVVLLARRSGFERAR